MPKDIQVKNAVVTGGTDGIGREIAQGLARAGHRLILVGRDAEKGARAARELLTTAGNTGVRFIQADLSSLAETERLAREVIHHFPRIHYLVHSAGIVRGWRELTRDGVESNFAVNFLSRFTLTQRLLPALEAAGQPGRAARVVMISGAAMNGTIHFDDVNFTRRFSILRVVSQFCAANDVFTAELSRRMALCTDQLRVTITCLKIGVVKTNIRRDFPVWMKWLVPLLADPLLGQTPQEAAGAALRLLLADEFEGVTGALFLKVKNLDGCRRLPTASIYKGPSFGVCPRV
jgi:NAD(P)-dependent dehydrogenase (short-subunit alcohol dehydrogenase family)